MAYWKWGLQTAQKRRERFCGEYTNEITVVNMTPDHAVDDAARACRATFVRAVTRGEPFGSSGCDMVFHRAGESATRTRLGIPKPTDFWTAPEDTIAAEGTEDAPLRSCDIHLLFDCVPAQQRLRVRMVRSGHESQRLVVEGVEITRAVARWAGEMSRQLVGSEGC